VEIEQLKQAVVAVLEEYTTLTSDVVSHRYQLVKHGWEHGKRYFYSVVYVEIKDDLVWVQDDNTEVGIANMLLEHGVPQNQIVLGFQPPEYRKYTQFNPSI
jgi:hypothetical protein